MMAMPPNIAGNELRHQRDKEQAKSVLCEKRVAAERTSEADLPLQETLPPSPGLSDAYRRL